MGTCKPILLNPNYFHYLSTRIFQVKKKKKCYTSLWSSALPMFLIPLHFATTHLSDSTGGHTTISWDRGLAHCSPLCHLLTSWGSPHRNQATRQTAHTRSLKTSFPQTSGERPKSHVFPGRGNPSLALLHFLPRQVNLEKKRGCEWSCSRALS